MKRHIFFSVFILGISVLLNACDSSKNHSEREKSVARMWNEALLESISNDFARPTVHARNLFHVSAASYDAWAAFAEKEKPFLLGQKVAGFECAFEGIELPKAQYSRYAQQSSNVEGLREEAISYAAYRMIEHRFRFSPGYFTIAEYTQDLMEELGYDIEFTSTDYSKGNAAALGNYIAECYIAFGLQDGSNEANGYINTSYTPINTVPVEPEMAGNSGMVDLNRWQPISLSNAVDQAGNPVASKPPFLSPEWGKVVPFALKQEDKTTYNRGGFDYQVYFDPGALPAIADGDTAAFLPDVWKWSHALVAIWGSHLDESDSTMIDISPNGLGNIPLSELPTTFEEYVDFYDLFEGGVQNNGRDLNPVTQKPYEVQLVKRGDYTRVLAEYWADGPKSVTPPGHWFEILNHHVNDHPQFKRRFAGAGPELGKLEWDVKAYFTLGGAVHDVAITAWGIKGWYDTARPVSAIRAMADLSAADIGDPNGIPLYPGFIEVVEAGDPLAGVADVNVGKIKLFTWRGPDYVANPATDVAGVGWILAENWWPYQRPTFVTPPFAGYISGHSTYSRASAEVLTALTGTPFFPGGLSEIPINKNDYLVFERGPSQSMTLQWATYQDASDQCSLSRIWGGIHPPLDDIPGRFIGEKIGKNAFQAANGYFNPN